MSRPKLSETLPGPREPGACQGCGSRQDLVRWRECDDDDRPTGVIVVTCHRCWERHVTMSGRLYIDLWPNEHHPGSLPLCQRCPHRRELACLLAKANGGPGVKIGPPPERIEGVRPGPLQPGWRWSPAERCSGLKVPALAGAGGA